MTSGGSVVRLKPVDVVEAGSLLGDNTSAAISVVFMRPRTTSPSVILLSRSELVGVSGLVEIVSSFMRTGLNYMMGTSEGPQR